MILSDIFPGASGREAGCAGESLFPDRLLLRLMIPEKRGLKRI